MRRGWSFLAVLLLMAGSLPVLAQTPTADQIELLRSMSPQDRDALMEQLGISPSMIEQMSSTTGTSATDARRTTRDQQSQRDDVLGDARMALDKSLKPEDSLLIDIDFKRDKPARTESPGAGLPPVSYPAEPAPVLEPTERVELETLMDRVRARNPYQLDATGSLLLPGFAPVMLAGLDEEQATHRLRAVNAFFKLEVKITKLPVRKLGVGGLKPFGYELFKDSAASFAPATDIPVPSDYVVGAGDQLIVQLFGSQNRTLRLPVGRDGRVNFPELGPINVGGQSFVRVAADIEQRVERQMIGVRASVSMGDTRSIRVFVMGEANRPGSYTVSGLGTITSALYAAGGLKPFGSLRDIQLKRAGAVIRRLDLYDLLLRGDTTDDTKLQSGDVIFIPPVSSTVAVDGEVHRPAIYEIKGPTTVADIVRLSGGMTADADPGRAALVRVNDALRRVVVDVPLVNGSGKGELLRNGDSLRVLRLRPTLDQGVTVEGHVFNPGPAAWRDGLRITDVIGSVDDLRPNADINYILIRRELPPDRRAVIDHLVQRRPERGLVPAEDLVHRVAHQQDIHCFVEQPGEEGVVAGEHDDLPA